VEGAAGEGGRTPSIWDTFSNTPGTISDGTNGDVSCDQYHRYSEDIELMKQLGAAAYRFSIAWPRIFPQRTSGSTSANARGVAYYDRLIDSLLEAGIEPVVTLYHWDLPQYLEDAGGWPNRDTAYRFAEYAAYSFERFSDRVEKFITLNEPWCAAILGYLSGVHAPGRRNVQDAYRAIHHLLLGHGLAVQAHRELVARGEIGITLNIATPRPASESEEDRLAADRAADRDTRMFLDPLFGREYPKRHLDSLDGIVMPVLSGDAEIIAAPIDFLGLNYYFEHEMEYDAHAPERFRLKETDLPKSDMGWDIVPEGLFRQLAWVADNYPKVDLYVTENGCAVADTLTPDGKNCHDAPRIDYLERHLDVCARAVEAGIPLKGYFLWSFIDNFEWSYGYTKRFGLVYCNYSDGKRVPKDSFYYYRDWLAETAR
jgi:beta-glucosidase